jgi:hypothetical protein
MSADLWEQSFHAVIPKRKVAETEAAGKNEE